MHQVLLSGIVGSHNDISIVGVFVLEHTSASIPVIFQKDVKLRCNVLGSAYPDVGLLLFLVCEESTVIVKFGIWSLGVELW